MITNVYIVCFVVKFHIAHVHELQGKDKVAKEAYEQLLANAELPKVVQANSFRQLGEFNHVEYQEISDLHSSNKKLNHTILP